MGFQSTKIQLEDAEGLREKIRGEMNNLESQMVHLGSRLDGQQSVIEKQLRTVTKPFLIFISNLENLWYFFSINNKAKKLQQSWEINCNKKWIQ